MMKHYSLRLALTKLVIRALALLTGLTSFEIYSCTQTYRGEEIDRQIQTEHLGDMSYQITVPKKLRHLDFGVRMSIQYYKSGDALQIVEQDQELFPKLTGEYYKAVSRILPKAGLVPYIYVIWQPEVCCECPAIGQSDDIQF